LVQLPPCREERLLRDVFAERDVAGPAVTHRADDALITLDQLAERFTFAAPARIDQVVIAGLSHVTYPCSAPGKT
jgi:hypothetical protein